MSGSVEYEPPDARLRGKVKHTRLEPNGRNRERFKLVAINDIVLDDAPLWLVTGLIPTGPSFGVIFGKPKSGKTFLAADLFFHVAMGWRYCDSAVRQGGVVYITSEGIRGFDRRMVAMRRHHNVEGMEVVPFFVAHDMPNLGTKNGDAEKLAQVIRAAIPQGIPVAAVIIDTLVRAMSGKNDSASEDMAVFVDNCETIARALQCFVGAVHHSPRGDDTRTRGSNVLDGGADVVISVVKEPGFSTAKIEAMKDGPAGTSWRFRLVPFELWDRNQNLGFACLCETISNPADDDASETAAKPKMTAEQRRLFDILCNTIIESGRAVPGSTLVPRGTNAVTRDQLKKCLLTAGFLDPQKPDSARSRMSKYLNQLAGKGLIGTDAEHVWLPK